MAQKIRLELIASDFGSWPTCVASPPADPSRVVVLTQGGMIHLVKDGSMLAEPFLDLRPMVISNSERGLLGLAFHPQYQQNGRLYVFHSRAGTLDDCVAEYAVLGDPATSNSVDPDSRRVVLAFPAASVHHGGWLGFGPDGYLYISTGDPVLYGQMRDEFNGKMLRIDVDGRDPGLEYAVPRSNPMLATGLTGLPEIWAWGLRNPWRCSFDRLTGDLWIGDVGDFAFEEINRQRYGSVGGENYGWPCFEAWAPGLGSGSFRCNPMATPQIPPVHAMPRQVGWTVIGGYVYRGSLMPRMFGQYVFADSGSKDMFAIDAAAEPPPGGSIPSSVLLEDVGNFTSFGEDAEGELYVATSTSLYRIVAERCSPADLTVGSEPSARGYGQPSGTLDQHDFSYFMQQFGIGNTAVADMTTTAIPGSPGYGAPNGVIDNDDFFYYLALFAAGC